MGMRGHLLRYRLWVRLVMLASRLADLNIALLRYCARLTLKEEHFASIAANQAVRDEDIRETTEEAVYNSVGRALSVWANMEESIVRIASFLLETPRDRAGIVMYSILNFNAWLSIIGELISLDSRYSPLKPKWNKISERLRRLKDTRDRLAHHTIHHKHKEGLIERAAALRPSDLDSRQKSKKYQPLTHYQITEFVHLVANIVIDLADLVDSMTEAYVEHGPLIEKSQPQDPDPNPR